MSICRRVFVEQRRMCPSNSRQLRKHRLSGGSGAAFVSVGDLCCAAGDRFHAPERLLLGVSPAKVTPLSSAFRKGLALAATVLHGQGETEAQPGDFPTPEAYEHRVTHLPGQSRVPRSISNACTSSILFVQQLSLIAVVCLSWWYGG